MSVRPLFPFALGFVVCTTNAMHALPDNVIAHALQRHATGDWGELPATDAQQNDHALRHGGRLFSAYTHHATHQRFWIITEADRSVTTILLPHDY